MFWIRGLGVGNKGNQVAIFLGKIQENQLKNNRKQDSQNKYVKILSCPYISLTAIENIIGVKIRRPVSKVCKKFATLSWWVKEYNILQRNWSGKARLPNK